ncbi:MAG: PEP-CTERM sorting domain-containing protein [Chthonomonadetes bacterium]|nr:PEP-CTERM sorting domain-containing protein [Chthonomonadetes bacterium]
MKHKSLVTSLGIMFSLLLLLIGSAPVWAQTILPQNDDDPIDYGYESENVCCVDVAAVNMLHRLSKQSGNQGLIPTGKSIKEQQEDFHKKYDPNFSKKMGSLNDAVTGFKEVLAERKFTGTVQPFYTKDLSYQKLVEEFQKNGTIMLTCHSDKVGGHALFLWGLETDPTKPPKLTIIDPNVHPNTEHKIDGKNTNSKGTSTEVALTIGTDEKGFPKWTITYTAPEYTYQYTYRREDGSQETIEETFPAVTYTYRITAFLSVSAVKPIPEPTTLLLFGTGLSVVLGFTRGRRRT